MSALHAIADPNAPPAEPVPSTAAEAPASMPLPTDPRLIFQAGIFVMGFLVCLYFTREIALPITLALALQPVFTDVVRPAKKASRPAAAPPAPHRS